MSGSEKIRFSFIVTCRITVYNGQNMKMFCLIFIFGLVGIKGLTLEALFAEKSNLFSYESEAYGIASMKTYLSATGDLEYFLSVRK